MWDQSCNGVLIMTEWAGGSSRPLCGQTSLSRGLSGKVEVGVLSLNQQCDTFCHRDLEVSHTAETEPAQQIPETLISFSRE